MVGIDDVLHLPFEFIADAEAIVDDDVLEIVNAAFQLFEPNGGARQPIGGLRVIHEEAVDILDARCRIDIGSEPFFLVIRDGALDALDRGPKLMRSTVFTFRATDEAWTQYWKPIPEPGWHDLFALTKRGAASMDGDLRPLLQNLQYFKDLLVLPRGKA